MIPVFIFFVYIDISRIYFYRSRISKLAYLFIKRTGLLLTPEFISEAGEGGG
jgi:hypothetical protein